MDKWLQTNRSLIVAHHGHTYGNLSEVVMFGTLELKMLELKMEHDES
jgi:hypothetical protein